MSTTETEAQRLTRAEIRSQIARYQAAERETLQALIVAEQSSGGEKPSASSERDARIVERARRRLNGHGAQLLPAAEPKGLDLAGLREDHAAIQLILRSLYDANLEAAAAESLEAANRLAPAWIKLIARRDDAQAELAEAQERLLAFEAGFSGDVRAAMHELVTKEDVLKARRRKGAH